MKKSPIVSPEGGNVIVIALFVLFMLTLIGMSATTSTTTDLQIAAADRNYKVAFNNADSGVYATPKVISTAIDDSAAVTGADLGSFVYLDRNSTLSSEIKFPENRVSLSSDFRFCAVRIVDMRGQSTAQVLLSEGFALEIDYEISASIKGPEIGFVLWNGRGESVFTSTEIDEDPAHLDSVRLPGLYTGRCVVSSDYLRHGIYQVDIFASQPNIRWLDKASGVIFIDVIDDGSMELQGSRGRKGIIAPRLHWDITRVV